MTFSTFHTITQDLGENQPSLPNAYPSHQKLEVFLNVTYRFARGNSFLAEETHLNTSEDWTKSYWSRERPEQKVEDVWAFSSCKWSLQRAQKYFGWSSMPLVYHKYTHENEGGKLHQGRPSKKLGGCGKLAVFFLQIADYAFVIFSDA